MQTSYYTPAIIMELMCHVLRVGQNRIPIYTVYDRIYGDFPAKHTVYKPHVYGSGQPYTYHIPAWMAVRTRGDTSLSSSFG